MKKIKDAIKKYYKISILFIFVSFAFSLMFYNSLGKKDTLMIFIATLFLLIELYMLRKNVKASILLFIASLPILVTSRKIGYYNPISFRVNYEIIYITVLYFIEHKNIKDYLKKSYENIEALNTKFILLSFAFIAFSIASILFSYNIIASITVTYMSIIAPFMLMLAIAAIFKKEDIKNLCYALIISIDFSCLYGFIQIFRSDIPYSKLSANREILTFGYHNVNIFATILLLIIQYVFYIALYKKNNKKEKIFIYTSLFLCVAALRLTYTRGAWIAAILCLFIILFSSKYKKVLYVFSIGIIFIIKPLFTFIISRGTSTTSLLSNESAVARIQSIFISLSMMLSYPFGTGSDTFAEMYRKFAQKGYMLMPQSFRIKIHVANYPLENAHNLWLQIGTELGIVCLILFIIIIINRIKVVLKDIDENRANIASLLSYLILSVLTGIEINHKGVITHTLVLYIVFAFTLINNENMKNNNNYNFVRKLTFLYVDFKLLFLRINSKFFGDSVLNRFIEKHNDILLIHILKKLGVNISDTVNIKEILIDNSNFNYNKLTIEDNCYIGKKVFFDLVNNIKIGKDAVVSEGVNILTHQDVGDRLLKKYYKRKEGEVVLEEGCWIGAKSVILCGVRVGKCSVIAAGSVVTEDVPDYTVFGGVPAKFIKNLNSSN